MFNLPSVEEQFERLRSEILSLKQSSSTGRVRPHKVVMMLAVLDMADNGHLVENVIPFSSELQTRFRQHFADFALDNDSCRPGAPFFHLRSSGFWRHKTKPEGEEIYKRTNKYEGPNSLATVQHAFLEDWAFEVVKSQTSRDELRRAIMDALTTTNQTDDRLNLTFHRGFALSRSGVAAILQACVAGQDMSSKGVKENTTLGTIQVEAMPRYAERCGLLTPSKRPTPFGLIVAEKDATLSHPATQWVMHYFISAPYRYSPNFWNTLIINSMASGTSFSTNEVADKLNAFAMQQGAREPSERTASNTANAFVGTYGKADALGNLEILEAGEGKYMVREPKPLPVGAFACILADYWANTWGERSDVLRRDINEGELAALLLLSSGEINDLLSALSERGLIEQQRRVPPFKVSRHWNNAESLWRDHLYS